jgi:hypothetical protein
MNKHEIDEFTAVAQEFKKTGRYSRHDPNTLSGKRFWVEQAKRSLYGHHIGSDFISGYNYFYLNFSPIKKATSTEDNSKERVRGTLSFDFPNWWDFDKNYFDYLEEAEAAGEHASVLKCRRRGYSFKGGSMCNRNYFLIPRSTSYIYASDKAYLTGDGGILSKAWDIMSFVDENTPWVKRRQAIDQTLQKRSSYKVMENGTYIEKGFKSEIVGITIGGDWNRVRGKQAKLILWEEAGTNPYLLKAYNAALPSLKQGNIVYGLSVAFGTGGSEGQDFMGLEELFFNPRGHEIHALKNIWEDDELGGYCGFFHPDWANMDGYMDECGNSMREEATKVWEQQLENIKTHARNPDAVVRFMAEHPIKPSQALLQSKHNEFPVVEVKKTLARLMSSDKLQEAEFIGDFTLDTNTNKYVWKPNSDLQPIRIFPLDLTGDNNQISIDGCWVIYEAPVDDGTGFIPFGRYIAGTDPVDDDRDASLESESLQSTLVLDTWTDRIVAEYSGRPYSVETYYENLRRGLLYYNAVCNYEQEKKGLYTYFRNKNGLFLLADGLEILSDRGISNFKGEGNRSKGTMGTAPVQKHARDLLKSWLTSRAPGFDEEVLNVHRIRSIPFLKELLYWNPEGNFDRVSAAGMLMLYRAEKFRQITERKSIVKSKLTDSRILTRNKLPNSYGNYNKINKMFQKPVNS